MTNSRRFSHIALSAIVMLFAAFSLGGCIGTSEEDLEKAREQGAEEQRQKDEQKEQEERQEELEKKIEKLEKEAKKKDKDSSSSSGGSNSGGSGSGSASRYCSEGLGVGPNTTCAFAENVRSEWAAAGGGTVTINVYSPVTGATYTMRCIDAPTTVCRGGNNAVVYIY